MKYSEITHTYSGGDTVFSIPFDYIDVNYIYVYLNDKQLEKNDYTIDKQSLIINVKLENGDKITIRRKTDLEKLVEFTGRNDLKSYDLNLAFNQILHVMQELNVDFNDIMLKTPTGDWNAENRKITNLAPATKPSDAVRKDQILSLTYEGLGTVENNILNLFSKTDDILTLINETSKLLDETKENKSEKGIAGGYCPLNDKTLIDESFLPERIVNGQTPEGTNYAPINNPHFTGVPTAPTPAEGNCTTQIATTQFVYGAFSRNSKGYVKFPNGLILQWGCQTGLGYGTSVDVYFPIVFPAALVSVVVSASYYQGAGNKGSVAQVYRVANNRFHITSRFEQGAAGIDWLAIGW